MMNWFEYFNKISDMIEKIPDYEIMNILDFVQEFEKRYGFTPSAEILIMCRKYIDKRFYRKTLKVVVEDELKELDVTEIIMKITNKKRDQIRKLLEINDFVSLYFIGVEIPSSNLATLYYHDDNNVFRSITRKKYVKEYHTLRVKEIADKISAYVYNDLILLYRHKYKFMSILPNPEADIEKTQILYIKDPISLLIRFVKSL